MQSIVNIVKDDLARIGNPIVVRVRKGFDEEFPKRRDYAYTYQDKDGNIVIVFSPKMLNASDDRIRAIMRHELSHGMFMTKGNHHHTEQQTDDLAERLWGDRISYDREYIQTLKRGYYPRPEHLPR